MLNKLLILKLNHKKSKVEIFGFSACATLVIVVLNNSRRQSQKWHELKTQKFPPWNSNYLKVSHFCNGDEICVFVKGMLASIAFLFSGLILFVLSLKKDHYKVQFSLVGE